MIYSNCYLLMHLKESEETMKFEIMKGIFSEEDVVIFFTGDDSLRSKERVSELKQIIDIACNYNAPIEYFEELRLLIVNTITLDNQRRFISDISM